MNKKIAMLTSGILLSLGLVACPELTPTPVIINLGFDPIITGKIKAWNQGEKVLVMFLTASNAETKTKVGILKSDGSFGVILPTLTTALSVPIANPCQTGSLTFSPAPVETGYARVFVFDSMTTTTPVGMLTQSEFPFQLTNDTIPKVPATNIAIQRTFVKSDVSTEAKMCAIKRSNNFVRTVSGNEIHKAGWNLQIAQVETTFNTQTNTGSATVNLLNTISDKPWKVEATGDFTF